MATVILKTNLGNITLEINEKAAPKSAANFLEYCKSGFYNNTIFHRVIDGFMIQGGGLDSNMTPKATNRPIENEASNGLKNSLGSVAMARTSDPHSATSQFFINVADNDFLNFRDESAQGWGYCVFGNVIDGMDVVKKISHTNTVNRASHQDVPESDIVIQSSEIVTAKQEAPAL